MWTAVQVAGGLLVAAIVAVKLRLRQNAIENQAHAKPEEPRDCPACDAPNRAGALFCKACRVDLTVSSEDTTDRVAPGG